MRILNKHTIWYFVRTYEDPHKDYKGAQWKLSFLASSHPHKGLYEVLWGSSQVLQTILRIYFARTYEDPHNPRKVTSKNNL